MELNEILNKYVMDKNNNLLPYGYYIWKSFINTIQGKLASLGFKEGYFFNENLKSLEIGLEEKYQMLNKKEDKKLYHTSFSRYSNMIEGAKTGAIDVLQSYITIAKNVLGISLLSGKAISFDDKERYILGIYTKDHCFKEVGYVEFYLANDSYYVYSQICSEIVIYSLIENASMNGLITTFNSSENQIEIIPLKMNEAGVAHYCRGLQERLTIAGYRAYLNDNKISEKEKLNEAIAKGVPLIIEVGPRDILNKNVEIIKITDQASFIVNEEKIDTYITNLSKKMQIELINKQIRNQIINTKNVTKKEEIDFEKINNVIWDGQKESYQEVANLVPNSLLYMPFNQELFESQDLLSKNQGRYVVSICKLK